MKKIKTLFKRDPATFGVIDELEDPEFEAVLAGEWVPTLKLDGTAVNMTDDGVLVRRQYRAGTKAPAGFIEESRDNGKVQGWVPLTNDYQYRGPLLEAFESVGTTIDQAIQNGVRGTGELCGPKVNGNRHKLTHHMLIPHGALVVEELMEVVSDYESLRDLFADMDDTWEGVVWHGPDGGRAKLKRSDFRTKRSDFR